MDKSKPEKSLFNEILKSCSPFGNAVFLDCFVVPPRNDGA